MMSENKNLPGKMLGHVINYLLDKQNYNKIIRIEGIRYDSPQSNDKSMIVRIKASGEQQKDDNLTRSIKGILLFIFNGTTINRSFYLGVCNTWYYIKTQHLTEANDLDNNLQTLYDIIEFIRFGTIYSGNRILERIKQNECQLHFFCNNKELQFAHKSLFNNFAGNILNAPHHYSLFISKKHELGSYELIYHAKSADKTILQCLQGWLDENYQVDTPVLNFGNGRENTNNVNPFASVGSELDDYTPQSEQNINYDAPSSSNNNSAAIIKVSTFPGDIHKPRPHSMHSMPTSFSSNLADRTSTLDSHLSTQCHIGSDRQLNSMNINNLSDASINTNPIHETPSTKINTKAMINKPIGSNKNTIQFLTVAFFTMSVVFTVLSYYYARQHTNSLQRRVVMAVCLLSAIFCLIGTAASTYTLAIQCDRVQQEDIAPNI